MKRYVPQPYTRRKFLIQDIDAMCYVEETTRKEVFSYLDNYLEVLEDAKERPDIYQGEDESFAILYSNGLSEFITQDYDGHPIRRIGIVSMVYSNSEDSIVFGPYSINEYGVVTPSDEMSIDPNIVEVE